jgi:putative spermidine/putrescine transport system substrate-binding protein
LINDPKTTGIQGEKKYMHSNKIAFKLIALLIVATFILSACATPATPTTAPVVTEAPIVTEAPAADPGMAAITALIPACKQENMLSLIATPRSWANYGAIFDAFTKLTGVQINSLDENAGSADELAAIEANKGNTGPQAPDIVDVGYAYGKTGIDQGLYQPYKVSTWDKIPDTILGGLPAKDPNGYWTGGYYGVMALEVNTFVVKNPPTNWADLLKPEYKGQVALTGDPRSSNQAIQSVFAAALYNGGSLDNAQPGLDFFNQLNAAGNFVPVIAKAGTIAQGATPIVLAWDYLAFGDKDTFAGNPPIQVTYPSPTIASMYVQAISAYAPHLNCAKLWMELLHSDVGQLAWMAGYAHGVNQADMESRGVIPADLQAKLPASKAYASAVSPNPDQLTAAKTLITEGWMTTVGVDIPTPVP